MAHDVDLVALGDLEEAREEWTRLAAESGNLFATWEWASLWWRRFHRDGRLMLTGVRGRDGALAALLPLYAASAGPVRTVRFVGHGPADELGPICAPGDRGLAAEALKRALQGDAAGRPDLFLGEALPADAGWSARLGARRLRLEATPVLPVHGRSWDELLASWSSNMRQQVRRRERKLEREHGLELRLTENAADLDRDFDTLVALHRVRWGPDGSSAYDGEREGFHRDFARAALERGWLRLWIAEIHGEPVAAWHGFRFGGDEWFYQSGRDPIWDRYSVGFVLLAHTIRAAAEDGVATYRLLRGPEAYKSRFATGDPQLEAVALGCGAAGRGIVSIAASLASRRRGRRLLRRLLS